MRKEDGMIQMVNNRKGFTLIEVLIAVFLLSVGFLSIAGLQTTAISGNKFAKDTSTIVKLAEEMMDRIRINAGATPEDYDNLDTRNDCDNLSDEPKGDCLQWKERLTGSSFGIPIAYGTVDVQKDVPMDRMSTVTVKLVWGSSGFGTMGQGRDLTLTTIIQEWGKK